MRPLQGQARAGKRRMPTSGAREFGGVGGIRTRGPREGPPPFQDGALSRSATTPKSRLPLRGGRFVASAKWFSREKFPNSGRREPYPPSRSRRACGVEREPIPVQDMTLIADRGGGRKGGSKVYLRTFRRKPPRSLLRKRRRSH